MIRWMVVGLIVWMVAAVCAVCWWHYGIKQGGRNRL